MSPNEREALGEGRASLLGRLVAGVVSRHQSRRNAGLSGRERGREWVG